MASQQKQREPRIVASGSSHRRVARLPRLRSSVPPPSTPTRKMMDGRPVDTSSSSSPSTSPSSSSLSGAEDDDTWRNVLLAGGGFVVDSAAASTTTGGVRAQLRRLWNAGAPRLREACKDAARDVAAWTRQGGTLRALLVVSVGSASLAALTGLLVLVFFVAAAATHAVVCSLLVSLVATGGFLAMLLAFLASMYIGALSVAVFVIATTTAATVIVITIATGWVAFFWAVWLAASSAWSLLQQRDRSKG